jgi:hypothetical protein
LRLGLTTRNPEKKMRNILLCNVLFASCMILSCGCGTLISSPPSPPPPEIRFTAANCPVFSVAYHAYGPCMPRHLAAPIPNYSNWTNERMARDLKRFQEVGFAQVLVCLTADQANEPLVLDRVLQFLTEADRQGGPMMAMLIGPGTAPLNREALAKRLLAARIQASKLTVQEAGRPVVFIRPGVDVVGEVHPALLFQVIPKNEWHWVVAGTMEGRDFQRENGNVLRRSMWEGYSKHRNHIVFTWNDFDTGNFIEPNSHDGNLAMDIVQAEIRRVEDMVLASATPPPLAD